MTFYVHSEKNHGGMTVIDARDYEDALAAFEMAKSDQDAIDTYIQDEHGRRIVATFDIHASDGLFPVLAPGIYSWCDESEEFKLLMV